MKISLSILSVHRYLQDGSWSQADFIDFASKAGAEGVELLSVFRRNDEESFHSIRQALDRNGLALACYGACNNLALPDSDGRKAQIQDIFDSIDAAATLGAKVVRVFSGDRRGDASYANLKRYLAQL